VTEAAKNINKWRTTNIKVGGYLKIFIAEFIHQFFSDFFHLSRFECASRVS